MNYCINPDCPEPTSQLNENQETCCFCQCPLSFKGYWISCVLRESAFSQVYEINKGNSTRVLKVTPSKEKNSRMANNPQREGEILQQLRHEGIPKIEPDGYSTIKIDRSRKILHCLMMEKIDGETLEDWLSHNKLLSANQLIDWLNQLLQILNYLHEQGYVHRDIKPGNIIVQPDSQLRLIDFGSARKLDHTFALDLSNEESPAVTACKSEGYTPPEQKRGCPAQQSDFFALARTMVHLATGVAPVFLEDDFGNFNWRDKAPFIPELVANLLDDMMAYKPKNRPENAQAILQRLECEKPHRSYNLIERLKPFSFSPIKRFIVTGLVGTSAAAVVFSLVNSYQRGSLTGKQNLASLTPLCNNRSCVGRDPKDNVCAPSEDAVKTSTSVLVNSEQQPGKTFRVELRYSSLCNSTWVRSWSPPGSFHYLQDRFGQEYGGADVKNDLSLPHQFSDMGPSDVALRACVRQPQGSTMCTNYISPPF